MPADSWMRVLHVKALRGPNIWAGFPVIEAFIDLGGRAASDPADARLLYQTLYRWFPGIAETASLSLNGEPVDAARTLALVAVELQKLAGVPCSHFHARAAVEPGTFKVIFEYVEERLARECLDRAREICCAAAAGAPFDIDTTVEHVRGVASEAMLGPSTNCIVEAARRRNIPFYRLDECSLVQLGYGKAQRRIRAAETDQTKAVAEGIAQDKQLTRQLLAGVGIPVPAGYAVADREEAWQTAVEDVGLPVVVKPRYGNQGRGVAADLSTAEQVKAAYDAARTEGPDVLVEQYAPGFDHRLLVVNGKVVAASRRDPAHVMGDGEHTVRELIEEKNRDPRRTGNHGTVLSRIQLDSVSLQVLESQGCTPESVPSKGVRVLIRRNANLSTGGTATDVTDLVHPSIAAHAVRAAAVVGLDVAGIDVIACDISAPLEEQNGVIVEVNAAPGLRMHFAPSEGTPRDVGAAIVEMLFPGDADGRIPIAAVTGTNGKTTVTRYLAHLVKGTGKYVGMTCTDGIFLNGRRVSSEDCSGPISARLVLMNPNTEAAVFETARGGILRAGLGFDQCSVAVVTNIADGDHLGQNGVQTAEDLAHVKATIVRAVSSEGAAVLNAADPLVVSMAPLCRGRVIYFSLDAANPVLVKHRAACGAAVFVAGGKVVLAEGGAEEVLLDLDSLPITFHGRVAFETENTLAAVAGAWAMGVSVDILRRQAACFSTDMDVVPGRMNVLDVHGGTVLFDYGHNAAALRAIIAALDVFPHRGRSALYTMAGDRRDADIVQIGEMLGGAFDSVVMYEPYSIRGRAPGEIASLIRDGLQRGTRVRHVAEIPNPIEATKYVLDRLGPGDLLVLQPDDIDESVRFVREYLDNPDQPQLSPDEPLGAVAARVQ